MSDEGYTPESEQEATQEEMESQMDSASSEEENGSQSNTEPSEADVIRELYPTVSSWDDDRVVKWNDYCERREIEPRFIGDIPVYDPDRREYTPSSWTDEVLELAMAGKLSDVTKTMRQEAAKSYRQRHDVPDAWSNDQLIEYHEKGIEPEKTSFGAWVKDSTRPQRKASQWSEEELLSWGSGEISATMIATDKTLSSEFQGRFNLPTYSEDREELMAAYQASQSEAPETESTETDEPEVKKESPKEMEQSDYEYLTHQMDMYCSMVPPGKPVNDDIARRAQNGLERAFQRAVRLDAPAFVAGMKTILDYFKSEKETIFNPSMAYRFLSQMTGRSETRNAHRAMIQMFMLAADGEKGTLRQMDIASLLPSYDTQSAQKVAEFFTKHV